MNSNEERKSKKIAIFSLAYYPFVGGAEIAVKEITDRLPNRFFCLTGRFDRRWADREKIGNVEVMRVGRGIKCQVSGIKNYYGHFWQKVFYVFRAWRAAEKLHRQSPLDAIWAIMAAYGGIAALLFKLRHPSVPLLLTLQEGDSESHILRRVGIFYPFWNLIFKKADHIQAISNYLADFARRHGARCPVEVVPNGVDVKKYQVSSIKYQDKKAPIIITTSRLVHKNGIDILIRAAAYLKALIPNSKFIIQILGGGPDGQKLKNLAAELGVEDRIEFLGHVEPDQIPSYLLQADIFVRPSRSEGLGSSFLEAMAAGLPIIGTPVGGIPDFLKEYNTNLQMETNATNDEANGLFVEVDNPQDLAKKIALLLEDDQLRARLGENGRKLVLQNYSWDKIAEKMSAVFQSLNTKYLILNTRLLIATGLYPPEIGGPATYTALLERELPKRGVEVAVLPFRKVRHWPPGIKHLLYFFRCFFMALKSDLVYAQDPVSVGLPAMLAAKITRRPFLIRVAGDYAWEQSVQRFAVKDTIDDFQNKKYGFRTELLRTVQKFVVDRADKVITPSVYFKNLVSRWTENSDKVITIYNGIQLESSSKKLVNPSTHQFKTILSAGRLVPWKGFDILIDTMRDLPDWKLVIVGDGPEHQNLKFKIENLKLNNRVTLTGSLPREQLLNYLQNSSVFVLNTSFESFSFQVVEAMNAGVPVITTNVCDLGEIIENGKEGILVEPDNKEQLLAAIKKISEDRDFREKIVGNAKVKVQSFSVEKTAEKLNETIKLLKK